MKSSLLIFILASSSYLGAISAPYYESLNEFNAVLSSEIVSQNIGPQEFVVSVQRKDRKSDSFFPSDTTLVKYVIKTVSKETKENTKEKTREHKYRVMIEISPNVMIGNPRLEVKSVTKIK